MGSLHPIISTLCEDPDASLDRIRDVFSEIAVVFQPEQYSSTEAVLMAKAEEVAQKVLSKLEPGVAKHVSQASAGSSQLSFGFSRLRNQSSSGSSSIRQPSATTPGSRSEASSVLAEGEGIQSHIRVAQPASDNVDSNKALFQHSR